ncbi:MAG: hypothetical protein K6E91_14250 [Butyrivibrio sp.]|nr:hypothetical protein [Butyrivibrio sp.]
MTESEDSGITTRSRNICLKALFSAGNIPSAFFNNVSLSLLKIYAGELLSDNITAEQIKQQVMELENKQAINGEEALSLLKQMEARRQDVAQKVQFISHDNVVNEQKDDGWAEDERKVKNLLADMIYSEDTWTYDETLETGDRMQKMMIKNIDAWILLFRDNTLLDRTLDKMPLPGSNSGQGKEGAYGQEKEDLSIKGQIRKKFRAILTLEQVMSRVAQIGDDPQAMKIFFIKLFETEMFKNAFSSVEEGITEAVNECVKSIQEQIANLSARIFTASSEVLKDPSELPDPNEK